MNQETNQKTSRRPKSAAKVATRTVILGAILLCVLVVVNLIVLALPADFTLFYTSDEGMSYVSDESLSFAEALEEEITVYWLCEDEVLHEQMGRMLTHYAEASDRISLVMVDPLADPTFTAKYTSSELSNYSLIVESGRRAQVIDYQDMFYYVNDFVNEQLAGQVMELSYSEYMALYETYGAYMDSTATTEYFQGEALVTAALDYVTLESIPHAYVLTGHGDRTMSDTLVSVMEMFNVAPEALNLQDAEGVPADANCVVLFAPKDDISTHEATLLIEYVNRGGALLLVSSPETVGFENLGTVCAEFGMSAEEGMVVDSTEDYNRGNPHQLIPLINSSHAAVSTVGSAGYLAYMPESHGIKIAETLPEKVSATALFATSDKGYRVSLEDGETALCEPATQYVGACAMKTIDTAEGTTKTAYFTWFASAEAFTDEAAKVYSGGNYYYLAVSARWMSELYSSPYSTISGVNLSTPMLEELTIGGAIVAGIVVVVVIPIGFLTAGLVIWLKRRSR